MTEKEKLLLEYTMKIAQSAVKGTEVGIVLFGSGQNTNIIKLTDERNIISEYYKDMPIINFIKDVYTGLSLAAGENNELNLENLNPEEVISIARPKNKEEVK